jgi:hypothetical protein
MMRTIAALVIITNTLAVTAAGQPNDEVPNASVWRAYAEHIPIGSTLSIRMTTGERLTAVLFVVDDTAMTVKPKTRVREPARRVTYDAIDELTVRRNRVSIAKYVGVGAAVGAGVFLWLLTAATGD